MSGSVLAAWLSMRPLQQPGLVHSPFRVASSAGDRPTDVTSTLDGQNFGDGPFGVYARPTVRTPHRDPGPPETQAGAFLHRSHPNGHTPGTVARPGGIYEV